MERVKSNKERLLEGLHSLTGIRKSTLAEYGREHDIFHVIDHPMVVGVNDRQYEKIVQLKEFLNAYQFLRENESEEQNTLNSVEKASAYFISQLAFYREREVVLCAFLNATLTILSCEQIAKGTVDVSYLHPREVLKRALQLDAVGIILAHNHPGGSNNPSEEDIKITNTMHNIFKPLGMKVFDHIIVGNDKAFSMNEQGIIFSDFAYITEDEYRSIPVDKIAEPKKEYCLRDKGVSNLKSEKEVEKIREQYPVGTKIELEYMNEKHMPPGIQGIIHEIDDQGKIFLHWNNGRFFPLTVDEDKFHVIEPEEELEQTIESDEQEMER